MNKEEFVRTSKMNDDAIRNIKDQQEELKNQYINESADFKAGDRFRVGDGRIGECYSIDVENSTGLIYPLLRLVKKDGTVSQRNISMWPLCSFEKL